MGFNETFEAVGSMKAVLTLLNEDAMLDNLKIYEDALIDFQGQTEGFAEKTQAAKDIEEMRFGLEGLNDYFEIAFNGQLERCMHNLEMTEYDVQYLKLLQAGKMYAKELYVGIEYLECWEF